MQTLLTVYRDLQESASTSDFPMLMGTELYRELLNFYNVYPTQWKKWCKIGETVDFKTKNVIVLSEADDLEQVIQGQGYADSSMEENHYKMFVSTYGRSFSITRQMIVNDDMDAIKSFPQKFGRASARKVAMLACGALEANGLAYDGNAFFSVAHTNLLSTALSADINGAQAIVNAVLMIRNMKDAKGIKMGLVAKYLIVPSALQATAQIIVNAEQVLNAAGTYLQPNPAYKMVEVICEDALLDQNDWYVTCDPTDVPTVQVNFLKGKQEPDLLLEAPTAVTVMGGAEDPFGFEYDEIKYKVRYDFGISLCNWQGAVRSIVA